MDRRSFLKASALSAAAALLHWQYEGPAFARDAKDGFDAVVIGAGLGGLACAAYMVRHGLRPLVIEKHNIPGGYATSFNRLMDGRSLTCEVSLHAISLQSPSTRKLLEDVGVWDKLTPAPHPEAWSAHFPGLTFDVPAKAGLAGFEARLLERFPESRQEIAAYFAVWKKLSEEMGQLDKGQGLADKSAFPKLFPTLWDIRDKTLAEVMDPLVKNPAVRAVLGQSCGYYGLPPSKLSAFYYLWPTAQYLEYGGDYLKGSSQSLSDALAQVVTEGGGQVLLDSRVRSVVVEKGRAVGVVLDDGQRFDARAVVCNGAVPELFGSMLPQDVLPRDKRQALDALRPSMGTVVVWLGLKQDVKSLFRTGSASFYPSFDLEKGYAATQACDIENCSFSAVCYDNLVPDFSPKGTSTVSLVCLSGYEPWRRFEADYLAGRKDAYRAFKAEVTRRLIARAEAAAIPGLSSMIGMQDSATPLTNLRFTANTQGAIYGFDQIPGNSFMSRLPNTTGVEGLFLASAWGNPGGGFGGALAGGKGAFKELTAYLPKK